MSGGGKQYRFARARAPVRNRKGTVVMFRGFWISIVSEKAALERVGQLGSGLLQSRDNRNTVVR
jgi:acyl-ACP thioesterase